MVHLLNSVSALRVTLISSKLRVYLLKHRNPVGLSVSQSMGYSKRAVLIGRTGFDTTYSIPDPTLSLTTAAAAALHSFPHSLLTVHLYTTAAAAALLAAALCDWTFRYVAFRFDEVLRFLYPTWKTLLRPR
jgi:hypothetical protein